MCRWIWPDSETGNEELEDRQRDNVGRRSHQEDGHGVQREDVGDDPGKDGSASGSCRSTEAYDCAETGGGKHVRRGGEEIGRPALMGGGGKAEESDGRPGVGGEEGVHVRHEHDRRDAESADEHGDLAAGVDAEAAIHEEAREPSAPNGADAGGGVDDDEGVLYLAEVEAVVVVEEFGQIEEVEPPDGVGKALGDEEGPESAVAGEDGVDGAALSDGSKLSLGGG